MATQREILFILKMQNQSQKAIGQLRNDLVKAAGTLRDLQVSTGRMSAMRGPTNVTKDIAKMEQAAASANQRLFDIQTLIADINEGFGAFDGTPYGEALASFREDLTAGLGAMSDIESANARDVAMLMDLRRRAVEALGVAHTSTGDAAADAAQRAQEAIRRAQQQQDDYTRSVNSTGRVFTTLRRLAAAALAFAGGNAIIRAADAWKGYTGQLRLVTDGEENLIAVRDRLAEVANRTYSSIDSTIGLFSKLAQRQKQLGRSQEDLINLTENFSMAMQNGGAEAQEAAAATRQFTQAIAAGSLRGDELNSIIENGSGLALAFEAGLRELGYEVTSLKTFINDANPSIQLLLDALDTQSDKIKSDFAKLPLQVSQGLVVLNNSWQEFIGKVDESSKATDGLGTFFIRLGEVLRDEQFIETVAALANVIGGVLNRALTTVINVINFFRENTVAATVAMGLLSAAATFFIGLRLAAAFNAIATAAATARAQILLMNAALLKNPIAAVIVVVAGLIAILYSLRDTIKLPGKEAYTLAEVITGAWIRIKQITSTVVTFLRSVWSAYIEDIKKRWGPLVAFVIGLLRAILSFTKGSLNFMIGAWVAAYRLITGDWSQFPEFMYNIFASIVNNGVEAANQLLNAWQSPLRIIAQGLEAVGATDKASGLNAMLDKATIAIPKLDKLTTNFGETAKNAMSALSEDHLGNIGNAALGLANDLGALGRAAGEGGKTKKGSINTDKDDLANKTEEGDSDSGSDSAKEALKTLQERIQETITATKEQGKLNTAIRKGPAAVRALNVELAHERELRNALKALHEAGVSTAEGSVGLALAQEAALAAQNAELAKQAEELSNLAYQLDRNIVAMEEQQATAERGLRILFETNEARRRELIYQDVLKTKLDELTKAYREGQYSAEQYAEEQEKAADAARKYADAQQRIADSTAVADLIDSTRTAAEKAAIEYDRARLALEAWLTLDHSENQNFTEDARRAAEALENMRPPRDMWDAVTQGLRQFGKESEITFLNVRDLAKESFSRVGDAIADLVVDGKLNFKELARSIIADIARMIVKALIFRAIMSVFGGGTPLARLVPSASGAIRENAGIFHTGGIAGAAGAVRQASMGMFAGAQRYHTGGLAGLKPGEVPVIAKRGEAILPTVRLPNGQMGVQSQGGGMGAFAPNINISLDSSRSRGGGGSDLTPEQQQRLAALLEDEMNVHLQRKFEEWSRPGGQLDTVVRQRTG